MRTTILLISFTVISFLLFSAYTFSQDDSLISVDYGKSTLSPDIVSPWKVQMETGGSCRQTVYTFNLFNNNPDYTVKNYNFFMELPVLAFRLGLAKNLEFRIAGKFKLHIYTTRSNSEYYYNTDHGTYSGAPIEAGLKYKFLNETKYLPKAAASVNFFIPAGDYYFHMDYISPYFNLMLEKNLSKKFSLGINAGYGWNEYKNYKEKYGTASISLNTGLGRKLTVFAEATGNFQAEMLPDQRLGAGLIFRFAKNVVAVAGGGFGISSRAPDVFGSGAIGLMFP